MIVKAPMTAAEFADCCEQLGPCELVRGEVVTLSPTGMRHAQITNRVAFLLTQWVRQTAKGRVLTGEVGIVVATGPDTVRGADVAYISYDTLPKKPKPDGFCTTPPELVVEVVGKRQSWMVVVQKVGEYLHMGVDRVWIIDPETQRVHVYRGDAEPAILSGEQELKDESVLPNFSCTVDQMFED